MSLSHHKCLLFSICHYWELNSFLPKSSFLAIVGNNLSNCWCWTLISENLFWFFKIIKIIKVNPYDILPWLCILISLLGFFICALWLFSFTIFDQNGWSFNFFHQRSCLFKVLLLQIESNWFLVCLSFFIKLSCFRNLLHIFTNYSNIHQKIFIFNLSCNIKSSLNVSHFNRCPSNTSKAFHIMSFNDRLLNIWKCSINDWFLKLF